MPLPPITSFLPRLDATESISSIKIIDGLFFLALANKSLTLFAPTPTSISSNAEPDVAKKLQFASPATALAINVLPVPGGPYKITPLGARAPIAAYLDEF